MLKFLVFFEGGEGTIGKWLRKEELLGQQIFDLGGIIFKHGKTKIWLFFIYKAISAFETFTSLFSKFQGNWISPKIKICRISLVVRPLQRKLAGSDVESFFFLLLMK